MTDKAKSAIIRGEKVDKWYKNREIQRIFAELREDIAILWMKTASNQEEERERLYRESHGLQAIEKRIQKIISEGKKAKASIDNAD